MQTGLNCSGSAAPHDHRADLAHGKWIVTCLLGVAGMGAPWALSQAAQQPGNSQPRHSFGIPLANRVPDANQQMEMNERQTRKANFEALNAERKRQLSSDSEMLLQMASELKAELDKSPKSALSPEELRHAEAIAKLARVVQDKMKLTVKADY